jgi:hypothetical protein
MDDDEPRTTSRGHFLRRLALGVGAGLGLAMFGASAARANDICCVNSSCTGCSGTDRGYSCNDSCTGNQCCVCSSSSNNCISLPCPCP